MADMIGEPDQEI